MIQEETYHHKDNIKLVPTYFTPNRMAIIKKWGRGRTSIGKVEHWNPHSSLVGCKTVQLLWKTV